MSTQSLDLTVVGWIGTEVRNFHETDGGTPFSTFRLGSTRRWFDKQTGAWKDGQTEWFNVKVWRTTALNVARSLRKGDPVIVQGRLSTEEWISEQGPRTSLVLEATALGHDLAFGSSHFARTVSTTVGSGDASPGQTPVPTDVSGFEEVAQDDDENLVPAEDVVEHEEVGPALAAVR
ncbi:single-stranded DNA-binding protein [Cellulomonas sp. URHE0023]|uniref:single-stranded DNA-binding protein n=1 Tax=Cellulomonas sp. URHE0023 TaxID=1380354 RepID=UPI00068A0A47|nr:single-stranded DNA-binding protein [Cellulomonas sp. URHE0023]